MQKKLLSFLIFSFISFGAFAESAVDFAIFSNESVAMLQDPTLTIKGQTARVQNGQGEELEVFSLTGVKVASVKIEANDQSVAFNLNRGIYIFRIGKVVRKVAIS